MKRMTAAALFSILASLFATANAFVDQCDGTYEKYTPNTIVERWQQNGACACGRGGPAEVRARVR